MSTRRLFPRMKSGLSKNVFILGLVSFFNDIASEMLYPIIPIFLTATLGVPVAVVGFIEGVAESTASLLKAVSGWLSDRFKRRKIFVVLGYSCSAIAKPILGLAASWHPVLAARFIDRFGKGIRTSARDALISESTPEESRGKAFGFHRGLDTAGAALGPLFAILLLNLFDENLRPIFFLAFLPALMGIILLIFFVKEREKEGNLSVFRFRWRNLDPSLKRFILVNLVFAIGNSSDAFLILRAKDLGLSTTLVILSYVIFNLTYSLFSLPAGVVSDRLGTKKVISGGFLLFALVYLFLGLIKSASFIWLLFPVYGIYMALTEGIGKAHISKLAPPEKAATTFGIFQTIIGVCTFLSSVIAGILWTYVGVATPFIFGSLTALAALILFVLRA